MRSLLSLLAFLVVASAAVPCHADTPTALDDVALHLREGVTTVEIRTSRTPMYQASQIAAPPRILVDFVDTTYAWRGSPLRGGGELVTEIRGSQRDKRVARIVIELARMSDYHIVASRGGLRVILEAPGAGPITATPAPAADAGQPASAKPLLYGLVQGQRGWVAYIEDRSTSLVSGYRVGDTIGAMTVTAIDAEHVVLTGSDGQIEVRLDNDQPGLKTKQGR